MVTTSWSLKELIILQFLTLCELNVVLCNCIIVPQTAYMGGGKKKKGSKGTPSAGNQKKPPVPPGATPGDIPDELEDLTIDDTPPTSDTDNPDEVKRKVQPQGDVPDDPPLLEPSNSNTSLDPPDKQMSRKEMKKLKKKVCKRVE